MYDYLQKLREATLAAVADKTPQEKADVLNIIECIIDGDMAVGDLVKAIAGGTVPVTYAPLLPNGGGERRED